jgi:two-component system chemotaxis response regulator CheB
MFTQQLAKRLGQVCGAEAAEARNGETLEAGRIYVAPGDFHLRVGQTAGNLVALLDQAPPRNSVRPAADHLFESVAATVGRDVMAFVLTGMGEDGKVGSLAVKAAGGAVMIQDAETSVVWGMPGAVHETGAFDAMGPIGQCGAVLGSMTAMTGAKAKVA